MIIREFDTVELKSGDTAVVVDLLAPGKMYIAEFHDSDDIDGIRIDSLPHDEIKRVISDSDRG